QCCRSLLKIPDQHALDVDDGAEPNRPRSVPKLVTTENGLNPSHSPPDVTAGWHMVRIGLGMMFVGIAFLLVLSVVLVLFLIWAGGTGAGPGGFKKGQGNPETLGALLIMCLALYLV